MNEFKYIQKLISQKSPKAEILVACHVIITVVLKNTLTK